MFTPLHVSHVRCQVSNVTSFFLLLLLFRQLGGASWWRICHQRGVPRLVYEKRQKKTDTFAVIDYHNMTITMATLWPTRPRGPSWQQYETKKVWLKILFKDSQHDIQNVPRQSGTRLFSRNVKAQLLYLDWFRSWILRTGTFKWKFSSVVK